MARPHKIWYRKDRKTWCVKINGRRHVLGPDKDEAKREFYRLMAQEPQKAAATSLAALLDAFSVYCADTKAVATVRWYDDYLQDFLDYLNTHNFKPATMYPEKLKPKDVRAWADQKGAKRARITVIKAAYRWGHAEGWIDTNPIAAMKRPEQSKREGTIELADMKAILRATKDKCFRDLLIVSWDTGARPQELRHVLPKHVEFPNHRIVLTGEDAKGGRKRVIYLTPRAERILQRNECRFRNTRGRPWTAAAVKCRFARLEEKIGKRFCQYHFRHAWVTRLLKKGIDSHIVAHLAGHKGTRMIETVYSHVQEDDEFMLAQAMNALAT